MPGPGTKKSKSKRGKTNGASRDLSNVDIPTVLDTVLDEIDSTQEWESIVRILCRMFDLPDLETRGGLKRVHLNFPQIEKNLEAAYRKYGGNEKVMGGIVGIWARMCVDSLLRNKLVKEGLLAKIMPLVDIRSTRLVALQALSTITHHSGIDVRQDIAKHTPTLLRLMEEFPDDPKLNELAIATLTHAISAVITGDNVNMRAIRDVDMPTVLRLVVTNARKPNATSYLISHALILFTNATVNCQREVKAIPSIVNLLVACLRSDDLPMRCSAVSSLFRLMDPDAEQGYANRDPQKFIAGLQRPLPESLLDALADWDPTLCDTYLIARCTAEYQQAMTRCVQDHDLYSLGKTLARLVVCTEYAIAEGGFQTINERTGRPELMDVGLPFRMWSDSLPVCAEALRGKGTPKDLDMADIIELKFLVLRQRLPEAMLLAQRAMTRNPHVAYFYYVHSLGSDSTQGLKTCKKGLKCRETTPFVRSALLVRAVDHAGHLGLNKLTDATPGDAAYAEGIAFLTCALEDAKTFISETPPDTRHMPKMLDWQMLLTIALRGKEISPDLRALDHAFKELEITKEFSKIFGSKQQNTTLRLTRELVTTRYQSAATEWGSLISRLNTVNSGNELQEKNEAKAEDNLAAWLEGLRVDEEDQDPPQRCAHPKMNSNTVVLYRCSYCNNPSAALRKCGGCGKTKYCDSACQKSHWSEHKASCKAAQTK